MCRHAAAVIRPPHPFHEHEQDTTMVDMTTLQAPANADTLGTAAAALEKVAATVRMSKGARQLVLREVRRMRLEANRARV